MRGFKHNEPLKFILKYFQTKIRCKNVLTWLLCISSTHNEMLLVIFWGFNFLYILFCIYIFWGFFHRNKNKEHPQKISKPIWLSFVIVLFIIRVVRIFFSWRNFSQPVPPQHKNPGTFGISLSFFMPIVTLVACFLHAINKLDTCFFPPSLVKVNLWIWIERFWYSDESFEAGYFMICFNLSTVLTSNWLICGRLLLHWIYTASDLPSNKLYRHQMRYWKCFVFDASIRIISWHGVMRQHNSVQYQDRTKNTDNFGLMSA